MAASLASQKHSLSSSLNPFDSDDESCPPSSSSYSNPFDDDAPASAGARSSRSSSRRLDALPHPKQQPFLDSRNPFDDDAPSVLAQKPNSRALDQGTLFDDDLKPSGREEGHAVRKSSRAHLRERVAASGEAALKKAQKLKDVGANQASKLVDGSVNQARKLKESSYNAFKSNDGHDGSKPRSQPRDQLLGSERESLYKSTTRIKYDDNQFRSQDLEYKSVQELEGYAVQKSEETTTKIENCLKVAEDIKEGATKTLLTLHEQGEQIRRTHEVALDIDQNLSAGEKLLGSLGGMFSKTWKPKRGRAVAGPVLSKNDSFKRRAHHLEQRTALGIGSNAKGRNNRTSQEFNGQSDQQSTQAKLEMERTKQDDALSDLSNVLDQLKEMSLDMGSEIAIQNGSLDHLQDDVITLDERVKGANMRGRRLLGK